MIRVCFFFAFLLPLDVCVWGGEEEEALFTGIMES